MRPATAVPTTKEQWHAVAQWLGSGSINIFGLPFAGKDTQGARIAERLNAPIIGGGDILRSQHHLMSEEARKVTFEGGLTPTDEYLKIVPPYLAQKELIGRPLMLSSLGRSHGEEESILKATNDTGHPTRVAIFLSLDETTARKRREVSIADGSRGQRADDAEHAIDIRMQAFTDKTMPVIDFYRRKGLLLEVDGDGTPDEVEAKILAALYAQSQKEA